MSGVVLLLPGQLRRIPVIGPQLAKVAPAQSNDTPAQQPGEPQDAQEKAQEPGRQQVAPGERGHATGDVNPRQTLVEGTGQTHLGTPHRPILTVRGRAAKYTAPFAARNCARRLDSRPSRLSMPVRRLSARFYLRRASLPGGRTKRVS